ncbi:hypothetical protein ACHQM5_001409 [Ranunculus cassubicifolius]
MGSERGSGKFNDPQPPTDTSSSDDDLLDLENATIDKHPELAAENTVSDDDLLGFEDTPTTPKEVTTTEDDLIGLEKKSEPSSPSSSSSASSDSFDENFFLMDDNDPRKSDVQGEEGLHQSLTEIITPVSSPVSPRRSILHDSAGSVESTSQSISPKQSPPLQVMDRLDPPDPNRIPLEIFARTKSTSPVEWSMQSNESLFSIHMGNNSFSRDQIFLIGRSQELGKTEDMFKFPNNTVEISNPGSITTSDKKSAGLGVAEVAAETMKEVIRENAERNKETKSAGTPPSISHRSEGSTNSTMSFAFPILTDGSKNHSTKHKQDQQQESQSQPKQPEPNTPATNTWFSCFTCKMCRGGG